MCLALAFSPDGQYLATVSGDNGHTVQVWDWRTAQCKWEGKGGNGEPPQVYGVVWDRFAENNGRFCTFGVKQIKFWERQGLEPKWATSTSSFGKCPLVTLLSAVFLPPAGGTSGTVLTGTTAGDIYVWRGGKVRRSADASRRAQRTGTADTGCHSPSISASSYLKPDVRN